MTVARAPPSLWLGLASPQWSPCWPSPLPVAPFFSWVFLVPPALPCVFGGVNFPVSSVSSSSRAQLGRVGVGFFVSRIYARSSLLPLHLRTEARPRPAPANRDDEQGAHERVQRGLACSPLSPARCTRTPAGSTASSSGHVAAALRCLPQGCVEPAMPWKLPPGRVSALRCEGRQQA